MPDTAPPRLGPHEAASRFACGCELRWDQRSPWADEEQARGICRTHGALRTGLFLGERPEENNA